MDDAPVDNLQVSVDDSSDVTQKEGSEVMHHSRTMSSTLTGWLMQITKILIKKYPGGLYKITGRYRRRTNYGTTMQGTYFTTVSEVSLLY